MCLEINNEKTISSSEVTLLGITIDWKLQFNRHVENICNNARKKTGALMRLRNKLNTDQKLILYNSFIKSQFGYCPIVWLCHGKVAEKKINSIQKRALRAVYNDFNSSFHELLKKGSHEMIHQTNLKHLVVKVYECLRNETPEILHGIFNEDISYHNLRINKLLKLPKTNTITFGVHSFAYRGSATWNSLPDSYKDCINSSVLKSQLKGSTIDCSCKLCV